MLTTQIPQLITYIPKHFWREWGEGEGVINLGTWPPPTITYSVPGLPLARGGHSFDKVLSVWFVRYKFILVLI